jgi:hypothetical protein
LSFLDTARRPADALTVLPSLVTLAVEEDVKGRFHDSGHPCRRAATLGIRQPVAMDMPQSAGELNRRPGKNDVSS